MLGGFETAGYIHRIAAVLMFGIFVLHLWDLNRQRKTDHGGSLVKLIFGPGSLMFNKRDLQDLVGTMKWFVGAGPRPRYGRWTYWEKFDYFAVFWGIFVIGSTGLLLWFSEFFTRVLPGWLINVATIIHSDEALLATGFIFTVHFFNTHLRPEKFPMDTWSLPGQWVEAASRVQALWREAGEPRRALPAGGHPDVRPSTWTAIAINPKCSGSSTWCSAAMSLQRTV
jgi:hypothetical protein